MADVHFFFDPGCPWAWLAAVRLQETAMRCGAGIVWRPVVLDQVERMTGRGAATPAELAYSSLDLGDWAHFCGVRVARADRLPAANASKAIAAASGLAGRLEALVNRLFEAGPGGSADPDDHEFLVSTAVAAGFARRDFESAFDSPAAQRMVEANVADLVARGGFGSASMAVGDRLYIGNARMPLVELALTRAAEHPLIIPGAHGQT